MAPLAASVGGLGAGKGKWPTNSARGNGLQDHLKNSPMELLIINPY